MSTADGRDLPTSRTRPAPAHEPFDVSGLLAQARRHADLSQRELAQLAGMSQSSVAGYESGGQVPRLQALLRLLDAAGLRLAVLDEEGAEVRPFDSRAARDNAGRRFPAHLDAAHPDDVDPYVSRPRYDRPTARRKAGFEWRLPGCSYCVGMNGDLVGSGKRCVSTSNRNFVGRQGKGARTHLASPSTAAATAIAGHIADPREFARS